MSNSYLHAFILIVAAINVIINIANVTSIGFFGYKIIEQNQLFCSYVVSSATILFCVAILIFKSSGRAV